ncbi:hypothetical protein [Enterococcus hirae]|nr:hypothetical protein [Enterococcus hirae]NBA40608.1 hypothetical protein [Enterococcus hirae]NBA56544.1 hypothetical protein [Enterococcus hirae]
MLKVGDPIEGISISGNYIKGNITRVLTNVIVVSNGIQTEVFRKKNNDKE